VAGGLLLHPPADVVDRGVRELADVEVIEHEGGVGQADLGVDQRGPVRRGGVERGDLHPGPPGWALRGQPRFEGASEMSGVRFR
jgi:hypothetical protein